MSGVWRLCEAPHCWNPCESELVIAVWFPFCSSTPVVSDITFALSPSAIGPHVLEVTGKPAGGTPTSREVDLQTAQNPGSLQKPLWQVSRGLCPRWALRCVWAQSQTCGMASLRAHWTAMTKSVDQAAETIGMDLPQFRKLEAWGEVAAGPVSPGASPRHTDSGPCVSVVSPVPSVSWSPLLVRTPGRLDPGPRSWPHLNWTTCLKAVSPNTSHSQMLGVRTSTWEWAGHHSAQHSTLQLPIFKDSWRLSLYQPQLSFCSKVFASH